MNFAIEPPESERATPIDLRKAIVELERRTKSKAVKPDEEPKARALCDVEVKLRPCLLANPRREANSAFTEQQRKIAAGETVTDAYGRRELEAERRTVVRGEKSGLIDNTSAAIALAELFKGRVVAMVESETGRIRNEQKSQYAVFGIANFEESLLLKCLSDLERRLDAAIPNPGGISSVIDVFSAYLDDLPAKPQVPDAHEQRLSSKIAAAAKAVVSAIVDSPSVAQSEAFRLKEARKREMHEAGLIKLAKP